MLLSLILLVFSLFLVAPYENPKINIIIVLPSKYVPYYDWLLDFPGWRIPQPVRPPHPTPMRNSEYSLIIINKLIMSVKPTRNKYFVSSLLNYLATSGGGIPYPAKLEVTSQLSLNSNI
jgi:hypothetical protein